jgi:hypothetical protein
MGCKPMKNMGLRPASSHAIDVEAPQTMVNSIELKLGTFGLPIAPYIQPGIIVPSRKRGSGGL